MHVEWRETSWMSLALLFHYLMLNMFRMLIHPSSGACDIFVELFHGLYCSGSMCVGVTLWFGWGGVVPTQQINRKLLRMDVLTSETCWALNNEIKSKWHQVCLSLFNNQMMHGPTNIKYTRITSFLFTWEQYQIIVLYDHLNALKETYHHPLWHGKFVPSG